MVINIIVLISSVYVWVGWWPTHGPDGELLEYTGGAKTDFIERYKLTLQTALSYTELDEGKEKPDMMVVRAGSEPLAFK